MTDPLPAGIHKGVPAAVYHADPAEKPSLSASVAKVLINSSPLHAWFAHPRLNPDCEETTSDEMDFGSIAHELVLGRGNGIAIVEAKDWRTKEAQNQRDLARECGKVPALRKNYDRAVEMVKAIRDQLAAVDDCQDAFRDRTLSEQVLLWNEDGTWFRNMADYIAPRRPTGHIVAYDLKTTSKNISPASVANHLFANEYEVQAAMLERGLLHFMPDAAGLIVFRFVVVETTPPYSLVVAEMDRAGMMQGRKKLGVAATVWRQCLKRNEWPGYPTRIIKAELPTYVEARWLAREENPEDIASTDGDPFLFRGAWEAKPALKENTISTLLGG